MEFGVFEATLVLLLILVYYYMRSSTYNYWKKLNIPGPTPYPIFGNFPNAILCRTSFIEDLQRTYNQWKMQPFFGIYTGSVPHLVINDLELVKTILIKEFTTFPGRGFNVPENDDTMSSNIFSLEGHRWKVLRSKLTPVFTTGKLKHMVELMADCAEKFECYLFDEIKKNDVIEVREAAAKFTTDVIGSCAFGINMNALSREDSEFRRVGRKIFESNNIQLLRKILREIAPNFVKILERLFLPREIGKFFTERITETIQYRERENVFRNDLVDLLRDIKNKEDEIDIKVTDNLLAAQAFVFFAAGFETSSTTISFVLYELALAPEIQKQLRSEIFETSKKYQGKLSYDIVNEMKFLNMVVQETLRKNSPAETVRRTSVKSWTIPDTNITLPAKTNILIPIYAFHHDSNYFENPEKFDPTRFDDNATKIRPMSYLPFGSGPKNCIGDRFAAYQVKLGVITILKNFHIQPTAATQVKYEIDKAARVLTIKGGVPLKFKPIK